MLRRALWIAGLVWIASWYVIYLEIYRWHHMTRSFQLNPPPSPVGLAPPHPGQFLLAARFLSLTAPVAFLLLWLARKIQWGRAIQRPLQKPHNTSSAN